MNKYNKFAKSALKSAQSVSLVRFIRNFNFVNPNWDKLPRGFPYCDLNGLTKEEKCLFDAITTAWIASQPTSYFVKKIIYPTITLTTLVLFFLEIISFAYWINIEYNLGIRFLTDFFA